MAISSVTARGVGTSTTSGTTVSCTPIAAGSIAADRVVIAIVGKDNDSATDGETNEVSTVTDSNGHTWTKIKEFTESAGAQNAGATVAVFVTRVTSALDNTDTVTATFANAITSKTIGLLEVALGAGNTLQSAGYTTQGVNTTNGFTGSISGLASKEYLWLLAQAEERTSGAGTVTNYTSSAQGAANAGSNDTSISGRSHHRILTATGETPTFGSAGNSDKAFIFVALEEVTDGNVTVDLLTPVETTFEVPTGFSVTIESQAASEDNVPGSGYYRNRILRRYRAYKNKGGGRA